METRPLKEITEAVEEALAEKGLELTPAKKAELVSLLSDHLLKAKAPMKSEEGEVDIRQLAGEHVDWFLAAVKPLMVEEFIHGFKHGAEWAGAEQIEGGPFLKEPEPGRG